MKFIHLTDPHLTNHGQRVFGLDPFERLNQAIDSINYYHADAEFCIITGDLAHTGDPEAYALLELLLEKLTMPCKLVLGNHDNRDDLIKTFPEIVQDDHGYIQSAFVHDGKAFIILDSVQKESHQGAFCTLRRQWLEAQLEQFSNKQIFLFMHHPPFKIHLKAMDKIGMQPQDAYELGRLLKPYDIRHIFFGHLHRPVHGSWQGIGFSTLRGTNHQVWLDFEAEDDVPGSQEPPAYAIVFIDDDQVVVHNHDYLDDSEKYTMGSSDWKDWALENDVG